MIHFLILRFALLFSVLTFLLLIYFQQYRQLLMFLLETSLQELCGCFFCLHKSIMIQPLDLISDRIFFILFSKSRNLVLIPCTYFNISHCRFSNTAHLQEFLNLSRHNSKQNVPSLGHVRALIVINSLPLLSCESTYSH